MRLAAVDVEMSAEVLELIRQIGCLVPSLHERFLRTSVSLRFAGPTCCGSSHNPCEVHAARLSSISPSASDFIQLPCTSLGGPVECLVALRARWT